MRTIRSVAAACLAAAVAVAASGCTLLDGTAGTGGATSGEHPPAAAGTPQSGAAVEVLETLPVKGRAPKTGYDRDQFGPAWADIDGNGCDQRNDVLARDLSGESFKPGTQECVVLSGVLADPYTGTEIHFTRGQDTSSAVQIDHVVALSDAWQKGAQQLSTRERAAFANDPLNLLAVDGPANAQKSDGDAATWLPPNRSFRCDYVARQVAVKAEYELWVTAAEKGTMSAVLDTCPGQTLPTGPQGSRERSQTPAPETSTPFEDCAAARQAGAAPVRVGDPGYARTLDGDGDGIACE